MHKNTGIQRIIKAFGYSLDGLRSTFNSEAAFRQELLLSIVAFPFIIWIDVTNIEKALLGSSVLLVLISELINTAIESVVNRISEEQHPLSKKAKDIGSAIVFVAFGNLIYIWWIILK